MQRLSALTHTRFGLFRFRSPLLTESRLFSLPMGTEMFHFPTFPPTALYIQAEVAGHDSGNFKVSLFGNPRITARLPAPHGLSQVTTSFIGSWCLGIHRSHLVACKNLQRCSRPLCSSQNTGGTTTSHQPGDQFVVRQKDRRKATSPSGPNSVPHPPQPATPFHSPTTAGAVLSTTSIRGCISQCSTNQSHPATNTCCGTR